MGGTNAAKKVKSNMWRCMFTAVNDKSLGGGTGAVYKMGEANSKAGHKQTKRLFVDCIAAVLHQHTDPRHIDYTISLVRYVLSWVCIYSALRSLIHCFYNHFSSHLGSP